MKKKIDHIVNTNIDLGPDKDKSTLNIKSVTVWWCL